MFNRGFLGFHVEEKGGLYMIIPSSKVGEHHYFDGIIQIFSGKWIIELHDHPVREPHYFDW